MKKVFGTPEVVAAIFTVVGTLLVSVILGFLEGRIGFESLLALFAFVLLAALLYALHRRAGTRATVGAGTAMVIIGFLVFFAYRGLREGANATPTVEVAVASATPVPNGMATQAQPSPSPTNEATATPAATATTVPSATSTLSPTIEPTPTLASGSVSAPLPLGIWQPVPDLPREILSIVRVPDDSGIVYVGTEGFVYRSEDAGATWTSVSSGLPAEDIVALCYGPTGAGALYAVVGNKGQVVQSVDGGASWSQIGKIDLVVGFENWLFVAPRSPEHLYFLGVPRGLAYSPNAGQSWVPVGEGLPGYGDGETYVLTLATDPANANVLYAGTGGWVGNGHGVYKSTDGGMSWVPSNRGMLDYRITALAIDPGNPDVVYAGGDSGELFKSTDGGATWADLTEALHVQEYSYPGTIYTIAIDERDPERVALLGSNAALMFSGNGGASWQLLGKPGEHTQPHFSVSEVFFGPKLTVIAGVDGDAVWRYEELSE